MTDVGGFAVGGRDAESGSEPARHAHCDMIEDSFYTTLEESRQDIAEAGSEAVEAHKARQNGAVVKMPRCCAYSVWVSGATKSIPGIS